MEVSAEEEVPTTKVPLELPYGFEVRGAEAPSGWRGEVQGNALVWAGGEIPVASSEEFSFEAAAPDEAGSFALDAIQTYGDGSVVEWTGAAGPEEPAPTIEVVGGGQAGGGRARRSTVTVSTATGPAPTPGRLPTRAAPAR